MKDAAVAVVEEEEEREVVVEEERDVAVMEEEEEEEKDVAVMEEGVVVERDVVVMEEAEEGTCSSKYPNLYSRHPCEYHRLCVREKRNSQLKEGTKPRGGIRLHRSDDVYFLV